MNITNNLDIAQFLNAALQDAAAANKTEKPNVVFGGNDKGLTMTFVDKTGATQTIPFGSVQLDQPKTTIDSDQVEALIAALDGFMDDVRDPQDLQDAKDAVRTLLGLSDDKGGGTAEVDTIDIYQLMALLVKLFQKQRETSALVRNANNAQAISAINAQIAQLKDAAMWGLVGSAVNATIQIVPAITACISAGSQIKAAGRCETTNGIGLAKTNLATAKLVDAPAKASANAVKLGAAFEKADATAFGKMQTFYDGTAEGMAGKTQLERAEVVMNQCEGNLKAAQMNFKSNPSSENFKALENAQKQQSYAYAKLTEAKANVISEMKNPAQKADAVKDWKSAAKEEVLAAKERLASDPEYAKIQKRLNIAQLMENVAKPMAEILKSSFEYVSKSIEADSKKYEIEQRTADKSIDSMTDLYKEAKQLMDDVRNFLQAKVQSEIETLRKIMV